MKAKSCLVLLLMISGIALLAWYAFKDIRLDAELLAESLTKAKMSGMVLENVEFDREISGDLWHMRAPQAERRDGKVEMLSPEVRRRLVNGKEWYFKGARGVYSEKEESADIDLLLGTLETDTRVLNLESPYLSWAKAKNDFLFPEGVTVYDTEFLVEASVASVDETGIILIDKGGVIKWTRPPE